MRSILEASNLSSFRPFEQRGRQTFVGVGQKMQQVVSLVSAGIFETGEIEAADLHQPLVVLLESNVQLGGDFVFRGRRLQALLRCGDGGLDLFRLTAFSDAAPNPSHAGCPECSAYLIFGVRLQFDVFGAGRSCSIAEIKPSTPLETRSSRLMLSGSRLLNPTGDQAHLGQVFQNEALAFIVGHFTRHRVGIHTLFTHGLLLFYAADRAPGGGARKDQFEQAFRAGRFEVLGDALAGRKKGQWFWRERAASLKIGP